MLDPIRHVACCLVACFPWCEIVAPASFTATSPGPQLEQFSVWPLLLEQSHWSS